MAKRIHKTNVPRVLSITSSATPEVNSDLYDIVSITALAENITSVTMSGTPSHGQILRFEITPVTANRTIDLGDSFGFRTYITDFGTTIFGYYEMVGFNEAVTSTLRFDMMYDSSVSKWLPRGNDYSLISF